VQLVYQRSKPDLEASQEVPLGTFSVRVVGRRLLRPNPTAAVLPGTAVCVDPTQGRAVTTTDGVQVR
jgi:hypothetical protein